MNASARLARSALVIALAVAVGLGVFAIWIWAQYNAVEHPDGFGLAGEVHPASGSAFPAHGSDGVAFPAQPRYCPSSSCAAAFTFHYNWGGGVTGWAGKYTGKHGDCRRHEFQSGVWLRLKTQGASSGESHTWWLPYECMVWTDDHEHRVSFTTPGGDPSVGPDVLTPPS